MTNSTTAPASSRRAVYDAAPESAPPSARLASSELAAKQQRVSAQSATTRARATSDAVERLEQIFHQVLPVLDSDAEADEAVLDAEHAPRLRRNRGVRHDRRMLDQALDAAERLRAGEDAQRLQQRARCGKAALDDESEHAAEAGHLLARELVLGMLLQPGPGHARDLAVTAQALRHQPRIFLVPLHPHMQRLEPAQDEEAVERPGY